MIKTGIVEWYDPKKGYGFIAGKGRESSIFVHSSGLVDKKAAPPRAGDTVSYEVGASSTGSKAIEVRIVRRKEQPDPGAESSAAE